jgi:periplasmic protein TonB
MGYQALLFCPDEKTARTVTHVLNDLDFTVEPCTEPFAAVKKLMAQHFDAVVVDCDNEQNATLLFKSARNSSSNQASLAVAVVEGQAGVAKAFRIGANLVLTKPINVEQAKGTLRVARGLLRKGSEAQKGATPAASVGAPPAPQVAATTKPAAHRASTPRPTTQSTPAAPSFASLASRKASIPAIPVQKPAAVSAIPSPVASTHAVDVDDQDSDAILEPDGPEPTIAQPSYEAKPAAPPATGPAAGAAKFPWQPSPKMAEPMASALRRAAEAAGQVEPADAPLTKAPVLPPAAEKRPITGAMFQAQGHAAAPARAVEKTPSFAAAAAPAVEEAPVVSKPAVREVSERKAEKPAPLDTTGSDVPPPTFFPGAYDHDEVEGGSKTKAIVIVAAVVLLAASAGYLSWKDSSKKSIPASPTTQSAPVTAAVGPPVDATSAQDTAPAAEPVTTDITLGGAVPSTSAPAPRTTVTTKPSPKEPVSAPAAVPEPEVTQRLIVRNDTRRLTPPPTNSQDQEPVQEPSAIGMAANTDAKALAGISSTPVSVPKPSPQMLRVSQGVMEGLVLKRVQPRYPTQALQMRIQGPVQMQATISKTGDIENLKVVSGDAVLARAAQEAVKQWKYKPYYLNGEPVPIETQILVNFNLPN